MEFAESVLGAAVGQESGRLGAARAKLRLAIGDAGLVDAAGVVAVFDATDRVVDATGLPLSETLLEKTAEIRAEFSLDAMRHGD